MKKLIILLLTLFIISCGTTNNISYMPEKFKIWNVTSYYFGDKNLIPESLNSGFFIYDEFNKTYYLQLSLSEKELERQRDYWSSIDKNVDISNLLIQIEVNFNIEDGTYIITESNTNYLLQGNNTEAIDKKLENIIYSRKIGQSRGLIPFITEKYKPNIEQRLPFPKIELGDYFKYSINNNTITLEDTETKIQLQYFGEHRLISK